MNKALTFADVRDQLRVTDLTSLQGAGLRAVNRNIRSLAVEPDIRIACLGNVTLDLLPSYIAVHCARAGWLARTHVGGIGQEMQDLVSPSLQQFAPNVIVLITSLRLLRPDAVARFTELSVSERQSLRDSVLDHIEGWVELALAQTRATLVVGNLVGPSVPALGVADTASAYGETEFHLDLNLELLRRMRRHSRVQLLDIDRIGARLGAAHAFDERMFHLAKTDWSGAMMMAVGEAVARHVIAARGAARKCLALDLDNTLWGGVLGEEGPAGIKVGQGDATSEAFRAFQQRISALKQRGVLLALCSKNNLADVEEAFRLRAEMPLRLADFAATAIGWEAKHQGLEAIAAQLNIGIDSLVFIDDNPAEIALVRELLPEVEAVQLPDDPAAFSASLDGLSSFEKAVVLSDDVAKTEQYSLAAARSRSLASAASFEDYLAGLQTVVAIRAAQAPDLPRVAQLCAKTNQFNVTTKRYLLGDLEAMLASPAHEVGCVSVADRFGDLGLVAVFILAALDDQLHVDTLLMSCRAMGRGVETAILNHIKARLSAHPGAGALTARFAPTGKNAPVASLFTDQGFTVDSTMNDGALAYTLSRENAAPQKCGWLHVTEE